MYHLDDTIAAIASTPGGAARGIVRLSGPHVAHVLEACFRTSSGKRLSDLAQPSVVTGQIVLADLENRSLPADVYFWPDARSYTRQPSAEIHTLGSAALVSSLLRTVCAAGARTAEPGEFTLRAFLAGRLDLTQAEAVLGVIDARGDTQLRWALDQLAGGLSRPLAKLRETLLELLAHLEAGLDFVEEDIEFVSRAEIAAQLDAATALLEQTRDQLTHRARSEQLPRVALVGWPNVGKSSLFNVLAGSTALVSDQPGTTRDYLTAALDVAGRACLLVDTAGYEAAGQTSELGDAARRLAAAQTEVCDVELLCLDLTRPLNPWETARLAAPSPTPRLSIGTKADRPRHTDAPPVDIATSANTAAGLDALRARLAQVLDALAQEESAAGLTAERSAESLRSATAAIARAGALDAAGAGEELIAAELRSALTELGKVVGAVYTDDILDRVFSRFCIGK